MARFIAFDTEMAAHLRDMQDAVTVQAGSALEAALADPADSILVLPGDTAETAILVRVHKNRKSESTVHYEASGFLGLGDEEIYYDDPQPEVKKSWWKKVF